VILRAFRRSCHFFLKASLRLRGIGAPSRTFGYHDLKLCFLGNVSIMAHAQVPEESASQPGEEKLGEDAEEQWEDGADQDQPGSSEPKAIPSDAPGG
jgi:hypothetical protein